MKIDIGFPRKDNPVEYDKIYHKLYNKEHHHTDKYREWEKEYQRKYYGTVYRVLESKYNRYRQTDRLGNYSDPVDFSFNDFMCRIATERCIKCDGTDNLGLGRKDHTKGHTVANTYVICWGCHITEPKPRR